MATTKAPASETEQTGETPVPAGRPLSRAVIWLGLVAGTAVTVLAVVHGIRIPRLQIVLSVLATWGLLMVLGVTVAELARRHHRTAARWGWEHGRRGALFAGRHSWRGARAAGWFGRARSAELADWAQDRWQRRRQPGLAEPGGPDASPAHPDGDAAPAPADQSGPGPAQAAGFPPMDQATEDRIKRQVCELYAGDQLQPDEVILRDDGSVVIDRRRRYPGATPLVAGTWRRPATEPPGTGPGARTHPTEGTSPMPDTIVTDDSVPAAPAAGRLRTGGGPVSIAWKQVVADTSDYEPEDDGHLLAWMASEVRAMGAYAEALTEVYETCVNSLGLDPVAMRATHDVADAAADAASAMAAARAKFAGHYSEVREFAASGGLLPFDGRWITGDGGE